MASPSAVTGTIATTSLLAGGRRKLPPQLAGHPVARIIRRVRLLALGDRNPDFLTHREIDAALRLLPADVDCGWVATDDPRARELASYDGVWLLPGTPYRDDEAAYAAIGHCLDTGTPFLGTCGGFQYAAVALARARLGLAEAGHAESDPDADQHVIVALQCTLYGERRTVTPVPRTRLASICGEAPFEGFHYCGYGLDDHFASKLQDVGVVIAAHAADAGPEALELAEYPFFLATAFQPQVGASQSGELHPILSAWLRAAAVFAAR
jgi:CTP synthase (UTP-ammonia lyase)